MLKISKKINPAKAYSTAIVLYDFNIYTNPAISLNNNQLICDLLYKELIALMRDGNLEAFNEVYNRYWKPLLAKAVDCLKNKEDATRYRWVICNNHFHRSGRNYQIVQPASTLVEKSL